MMSASQLDFHKPDSENLVYSFEKERIFDFGNCD